MGPCVSSTRRTTSATSWGGRLSTTKKPRSSSSLAAVLRPAPVIPVTTTTSPAWSGAASCSGSSSAVGSITLASLLAHSSGSPFLNLTGGRVDADRRASVLLGQGGRDGLRGADADAGHLGDLVHCGSPELLERAEPLEHALAAHLAQSGHVVEQALDHALGASRTMVGDREPVRLVADPLQQVQPFAGARQDHRVLLRGQPHLLEPLGQTAHRHVVD